ncbi:MAG: gliding motility-associated C-terminal domain-containing protein [Bacteroidetes bacterium]|nr:gliding motility-associated C-terminal domain-containing protein [Bacteroidota bacterium]
MVAYYPFNGNASDQSGNGNNGNVMNGAQLTTDKIGNSNSAYHFDGLDDYIQIPNSANLNPSNALTISLNFSPEQNGVQTLLGKIGYNLGVGTQFQVAMDFSLYPGVLFGVNSATDGCASPPLNAAYVNTSSPITTNQWYCVVATFENGIQKIYLNGILIQSKNAGFVNLNQCANADIQIGSWWSGDPQQFKGKIDEVRIYSRALNQQEVNALCNVQTTSTLCNGSLGDPVVNVTFGSGNNPGPNLSLAAPGASTTLTYVPVSGNPANPTPIDGQYTITNNVPYNVDWFSGSLNHTPNDPNGYMAFYNSSEQPGEFYNQTVTNLCGSTTYEFAAWIANVLDPSKIIGVNPDITFRIEQSDGTVLGTYDTGPISQTNNFSWQQYGFYFTTPSNVSTVVLRMINNSPGGLANVGNDLAIDDITFRPCGPTTTASFSQATSVDSISICESSAFSLYGNISTGYANPGFLWQVSSDSGKTWIDIPNSSSQQINLVAPLSPLPRNYKYRLLAGDGLNINSNHCRVISNETILNIKPRPQTKLFGGNICAGDIANMTIISATGISPFSITYTDSTSSFTQNNILNGSSFTTPYTLTDTTTFILTSVSDASGCTNSNPADSAIIIYVNPLPQGGITGSTACAGSPILLNFNTTQGSAPFTFQIDDGINVTTIVNPVNGVITLPPATNGNTYTLKSISDNSGCVRTSNFISDIANVNILPSPKISFGAINDVCNNDSSFIITQVSESSGLQGIGVFSGNGVSPTGFFDLSKIVAGVYPIQYKFTATNGCADSATQPVTVKPVPFANAGPDILGCINTSIQLNASGGEFYSWAPPTGLSDPSISNPVVTIGNTVSYVLAVTNKEGCTAYDSLTITISPLGKNAYKVPNAFTPNGDGKNDCFGLKQWGGIELKEFSIYNRWGQLVFATKNPSDCWDGTFKGTPQDSGGFIYIIRALTPCGNVDLKGTVFLIR